jgi:hypothetical protein
MTRGFNPDLPDRHLTPTTALKQGLPFSVSKAQQTYVHAPLSLFQDRVPHGGRVARALDRVPGIDGIAPLVEEAGGVQLSARRDPPVARVDEEPGHER